MHIFLEECIQYTPQMPSTIYHYCSVDTMLNIISNYCLWLSDVKKTNDITEMSYFCIQMQEIFSGIFRSLQGEYDETLLLAVENTLKNKIEAIVLGTMEIVKKTKDYVCCFSEAADLLSQWRAYGSNGQGVSIGFNAPLLSNISDMYRYDFVKIIYGERKILNNIRKYMEISLKNILNDLEGKEINTEEILLNASSILIPILQERFVFKHPSFKEEKEWRLYQTQVGNFDEDAGEEDPFLRGAFYRDEKNPGLFSCSELKFRSSQNDICSYFELDFEKCKDTIIKEIILGPKCQIEEWDLKLLLRKYNYIDDIKTKKIPIKKSKIPYV